jgi:hypothetical protein
VVRDPKSRGWLRAALLLFVVTVPLGCLCARVALAQEQSSRSVVPEQTASPRGQVPGLDSRAKRLAKLLDLTETQQAKLAQILASQHEQIRKLWSDQRVPSEYRVGEMRAINDKTEDQIRALLNDEQKKKYIASHAQQTAHSAEESNLDYWLNATKPK